MLPGSEHYQTIPCVSTLHDKKMGWPLCIYEASKHRTQTYTYTRPAHPHLYTANIPDPHNLNSDSDVKDAY